MKSVQQVLNLDGELNEEDEKTSTTVNAMGLENAMPWVFVCEVREGVDAMLSWVWECPEALSDDWVGVDCRWR